MPKTAHIFAVFAIIILLAAALQPAIASPVKTLQDTNSTPEHSYVTGATASALASLVQMRDTANQHRRGVGIDVEALINATPGPEINFSIKWGSAGNAPGQFIEPWDAAFDSKGNIYVLDTGNNRVQKFYPNGTFIAQWGSAGNAPGQFNLPRSIALCPGAINDTDLVFVADTGNHRIQKFYSNGTFIAQWGSEGAGDAQFRNPSGIAADIAGNVFVADTENYRIQKFNSSGGFITKWGSQGTGNGTFNLPSGIAIDNLVGTVFVADTGNHRIQKFNSSGGFITKWGSEGATAGQFELPQGVAIDSSGNVFVADTGNHRIQKFGYNGSFILKWGSKGTGNGTFKAPAGIAVDADGLVYVADTDNNRVQKFSQRDNDADSIPNSVELVLGTDPNYYDTDRDMLNDSYEVRNKSIGTDPLKLDSNGDGMADYYEVTNVSLDVDGDGIPNAWDCDNDGDGVVDGIDKSPFTKSTTHDKFHFDIKTKGNATYIDFQVRPKNPEHMKLPFQSWDWPDDDDKGQIKDLDYSKDDVHIQPMLELTIDQTGQPDQYYRINNKNSGKCLDVSNWHCNEGKYPPDGNKTDGANVQQWTCTDSDTEKWKLEPVGDDYYRIINKNSGKCLDVSNWLDKEGKYVTDGNKKNFANVQQWKCTDSDTEKWKLEQVGDGYYRIINKNSGKCLEVGNWHCKERKYPQEGNKKDGANVQQWTCTDGDTEKWKLEPVDFPNQSKVKDYGVVITGNKAYIPLTPVQDYGTTVAFNARMFYPASAPLNLSADAKLVWMVNDKIDKSDLSWSPIIRTSPEIGWMEDGGGAAIADINGNGKPDLLLMGITGYRIGWDLKADGKATSWSPIITSPYLGDHHNGGGAAIADINGNGKPDLLLMGIESEICFNKPQYRIGWDLKTDGKATSWSPIITSPALEYVLGGGGAAIADINGNGTPDLLLMGIFHADSENCFNYRIGWDLKTDGKATNWSREYPLSPDIPRGDYDGGGAAIADINGNGKPDLLLMGIDDPERAKNEFRYMIGWDLKTDGEVTSWSGIITSPEIGWEEGGGGAAIADINGNGKPDLLLMGIESEGTTEGANVFRYRIGWDMESEVTTIARYKEDFMLTGFSVEENYGADAGLFYSGDRNQTMNAYLVLRYEFLRSQNSLLESPKKLEEHNVSVTSNISSYSHQDAALIAVLNKTKDALRSLPDGKILPIVFALSDVSANSAMGEFVSGTSYILGDDYDVDLTNKSKVTGKSIKMSWYNTTTDEIITFDELLEEVKTWDGDVEKKANMLMLLLIASFGEITLPGVDGYEIEFEDPEECEVLGYVKKGYCVFAFLANRLIKNVSKLLERRSFLRVKYAIEGVFREKIGEGEWGQDLTKLCEDFRSVSVTKNMGELKAVMGEEAIAEEAGWASKLAKIGDVLNVVGVIIVVCVAIYTFIAIAKAEGWSAFGFAVGGAYAAMQLIFSFALMAIFFFIACIPEVGWIIDLVIIIVLVIVGIIASIFGYGASQLMEKLISLFINVKLRVNLDLEQGETTVNIVDYHDNGLTAGDKIAINSWFWAKASETSRGKDHGDRDDYNDSYIHPKYEYTKDDSTFDSGSYDHYCDMGGWTKLDQDLNQGAGKNSNYIYLCIKPPVLNNLKVISGDHLGISCGSGWTKINNDLNEGTGAEHIYLCVKEPVLNNLKVISGDHSGISCGSGWTKINNDLNEGTGVEHIYLCVKEPVLNNLKVFSSFSEKKCYTGLWLKPEKSMINLPLTVWLSSDYKFYYDECCCGICSGKSNTSTIETKHDTRFFDVLPNDINDFVRWHAISLRDNDGDGLMNSEEKGSGENYYKICAEHSGKCLDVSGSSTANGANVEQWEYEGTDNQKWKLEPVGEGYHKICAKHSGKCLSIEGAGEPDDGASVVQKTYGGLTDQNWRLEHVGDGNYKIINNRSSKCLNVSHNSTANGANVWQWTWWNKENQKWKLVPVECDTSANHWDTDADGLSDMFEVLSAVDYGTNPRIADTDADGLTDMLEFELGTRPDEKDTDADGLTDFEEHRGWRINFTYRGCGPVFNESVWSNPLFNDSDMDGLNDSEEYRVGFNPRSRDTNGDGISDYDEVHGKSVGASPKVESSTMTMVMGTDEDGLTDEIETAGWDITLTNSTGTHTIHVTSEPLLQDTDFDGLNDSEEYNLGSNPRHVDTDGDGLNDFVERELGTNITHYDTDSDGLDDGTEITFGSDAKQTDTDSDGLSDFEEFELGSDASNPDTDSDGLTDLQEKQFNSSLLLPDSDADLLFDNEEYNLSTDPWNPDTDGDNLTDGYEIVYNTSATNNDTDADGILDGDEIDLWTNPLCNDTDGDGLNDSWELELGTNPVNADTNGDGINDSEDPDTHVPQVERVALAHDTDDDTYEFVDKLASYTNVTVVTAEELMLNYSDEPYIVIVGRPDGNGTAGNVTRDILESSGDVSTLTEMLESDYDRLAVSYGVWTPTQTVVMLSHPYKYDYCRVLSILKDMTVTRLPDSVEVEFPSARDFFSVEMVKEIDSSVWVDLEEAVTPWVKMNRYNALTTPFALTHASGLADDEEAVGRYLEIEVNEEVQNGVNWAWGGMYYTASDLDRNGDGDANDVGDIDEDTLKMYYFDESAGKWIELSADLDWVFDTGVDTTDVKLYGKEYEGFVWANVSHFCLFGLAGETIAPTPTPTPGHLAGGGAGKITPTPTPTSAPEAVVTPIPAPSLSPIPTVAPALTPSPTPVPTPKPLIPRFEAIMWLLAMAIAVLILMGYLRRRKRREL